MTEGKRNVSGRQGALGATSFTPFEMWSEWIRNSMGGTLGAAESNVGVGEKGTFGDPLLAAVEQVWKANPLHEVLPIDWVEITRALQTLWIRQMSDPRRAMEATIDFNVKMWESAMGMWGEAVARTWGLPVPEQSSEARKGRSDKRFSAPDWEDNPYYNTLKQMYLLASDYLLEEAQKTGGQNTEEQRRLEFHLKQFVDAMAPMNFLLTNPAAVRRAIETRGMSLVEGARNLLGDLEKGRLSMVDAEAFEVGKNLAVTPGKVVYRNRLIELIQYEPQTEQTYQVPLLWIPPWINKYYILDMQPKNSFVKYMLEQGFQVFMISWKNPDASMEDTKFEDYMTLGPLEAAEVVREITGSERVNPMGYCIGGTLLSMTLPYLEARGENFFGPATFIVTLQDFSEVGDTSVFVDEPHIDFIEQQMMERGYLDSRSMSNMFNLLRSNDLIWSNVINNYLLGQKPPAFDLLYWNSDGTRMARDAYSFYIRNTYLENNLIKPGKIELKGEPIDLGRINQEVYAVGAKRDHIVPWQSAWKISNFVSGDVRFVLTSSGHIAGIINPPSRGKGNFWTTDSPANSFSSAEEWLEATTQHDGSWWTDWVEWLGARSGEMGEPPQIGSDKHPPLEEAPGAYVRET